MEFKIREAVPSDAEQILLHTKICGGETDNMSYGEEGFRYTVEQEKIILENVFKSKRQLFLVAEVDGKIVGTANYTTSNMKRLAHRGSIGLCVQRKYWNQGIATSFMEHLIQFAKEEAKAKIISLGVRSDNESAIHLYEKFGFQKIGTFEGYYEIDDELIDVDYMNLKL